MKRHEMKQLRFKVEILTVPSRRNVWEGGHDVTVEVVGQSIRFTVNEDGRVQSSRSPHQWFVQSTGGQVTIPAAGVYTLTLRPRTINAEQGVSSCLCSLVLRPQEGG